MVGILFKTRRSPVVSNEKFVSLHIQQELPVDPPGNLTSMDGPFCGLVIKIDRLRRQRENGFVEMGSY